MNSIQQNHHIYFKDAKYKSLKGKKEIFSKIYKLFSRKNNASTTDYSYYNYNNIDGMFISGTLFCDFHILIHKNDNDNDNDNYTISMYSIIKNSSLKIFNKIFEAIGYAINDNNFIIINDEELFLNISQEELTENLTSAILLCENLNNTLEASKIFCELSEYKILHPLLVNYIPIIKKIITICPCGLNMQFSIFALSKLIDYNDYICIFLHENIFQLLIPLVINGTYSFAKMRRECVKILTIIAKKYPNEIIEMIGKERLILYLNNLKLIVNKKIKKNCINLISLFYEYIQ